MNRRILTAIAALMLSCSLTAAPKAQKPWSNGKLQVSSNQRYLQHENGQPFFWLGETAWLMPEHLDRKEVGYYLQCARKAGYNMAQVQVLNDVPSYNIYGQQSNPYGWDMSKADPDGVYSYWDHMDYIIDTAEKNGIYIGMVTVWGHNVDGGLINAEQAKAYGEFLANRYKDKPNIIWIMGGDIRGDIHPEVWESLATTIKSIDKNHLMTYHPRGRFTSARWWSKAEWLDFHMFQSGHRRYGQRMGNADYPIPDNTEEDSWMYVDSTWAYKPIRPVLDDEPSYEAIPKGLHDPDEGIWNDADVRRYAYWSVFAGSCGHTYGHNSIMQFLKPGYATAYGRDGEQKTWYEALEDPGFHQMHWVKDLMLSLPYFERVPDQSVIQGENGTRYDRLIATRGNDYILVYNYTSRDMNVSLKSISGKEKKAWWMDAATGKLTFLGTTKGNTYSYTPQKPAAGEVKDGVLIIIDASKTYLKDDQQVLEDSSIADRARNLQE